MRYVRFIQHKSRKWYEIKIIDPKAPESEHTYWKPNIGPFEWFTAETRLVLFKEQVWLNDSILAFIDRSRYFWSIDAQALLYPLFLIKFKRTESIFSFLCESLSSNDSCFFAWIIVESYSHLTYFVLLRFIATLFCEKVKRITSYLRIIKWSIPHLIKKWVWSKPIFIDLSNVFSWVRDRLCFTKTLIQIFVQFEHLHVDTIIDKSFAFKWPLHDIWIFIFCVISIELTAIYRIAIPVICIMIFNDSSSGWRTPGLGSWTTSWSTAWSNSPCCSCFTLLIHLYNTLKPVCILDCDLEICVS